MEEGIEKGKTEIINNMYQSEMGIEQIVDIVKMKVEKIKELVMQKELI